MDVGGSHKQIALVFVPYTSDGICETFGNFPKAWIRAGKQNILMDDRRRQQVMRDKKIVEFERTRCCPYDPDLLDRAVLDEFKRAIGERFSGTDEDLLFQKGALNKAGNSYEFTKAGVLFFAANPQRVMPYAYIRLLRFSARHTDRQRKGLPNFERNFSGPLTKQIRELRTFFKESGFFKTYSRRKPAGGFFDEPEFPHIAVDEAIVNAVAHRDYAVSLPIECESFADAFLVSNPGVVLQRNQSVPDHFTLDSTVLDSMPRNSHLIEWLKIMRDEHGGAFVRALSEGTKKMHEEMVKLGLPAPEFDITAGMTCLQLFNKADEREARLKAESAAPPTEYANLFPVSIISKDGEQVHGELTNYRRRELTAALRDVLASKGWFVDSFRFGRLVAHRRGVSIPLGAEVEALIRFYPAFAFQFHFVLGRYYLSLDYTLEVKNALTLAALLHEISPETFVNMSVIANQREWFRGKIQTIGDPVSRVFFAEFDRETQVGNEQIYPLLPKRLMLKLLERRRIKFDLNQAIKQHSLSLEPNAARVRSEKTLGMAQMLADSIFPLKLGPLTLQLDPAPTPLTRDGAAADSLRAASLTEPTVEFSHHHESANIRDGITKFGAYQSSPKEIELVPICTEDMREKMASLIQRLKAGQFKYRGAERTFSSTFSYGSIVTVPSSNQMLDESQRIINEHPAWRGDNRLPRIFLVHTPEAEFALDDETSPYFRIKRFLFENGLPCQMVDTPTLRNPDWKDLNLALNIAAKCGVTPWVLPGAIPDADFFVGLSYTQSGRGASQRLMGYANVFNQYGRWMFYSGSSSAFDYDARASQFETLTKSTLERLNLSETPSIYFHYSAKFSKEDKAAILRAAQSVRPKGTYYFVWINLHHNVRLYDSRAESDGSFSRGSFVITSSHQFYLSTTGYNPFRRALGTPHMLEINASVYRPESAPNASPDQKGLAMQLLSLTKLNWGSTDSLCGEPITTKYAGDIAYLTAAFLRQAPEFKLHPVLEQTPWFI